MGDYLLSVVQRLWPGLEWALSGSVPIQVFLEGGQLRFDVRFDGGKVLVRRRDHEPVKKSDHLVTFQYQWWCTADIGDHNSVVMAFIAAAEEEDYG